MSSNPWHGGKGDRIRKRKVTQKQYNDNWDRIFGNKPVDKTDSKDDAR
jgi:hypothetical protein